MEENVKKVLLKLQARCVRREYCVSEMRKKALLALEGNVSAAEEVLEALIADKFVSDLRYASAFAREKASLNGWGPVKIRYMLSSKGISRETIAEALSEIELPRAEARLETLLLNKWRALKDDPQGRLKLLRFALSRGYEYDDVASLVERITRV